MADVRDDLPTLVDIDVPDGAAPVDEPVLVQTSGLETGRVLSLSLGRVTLGRDPEATHRFDDAAILPIHAVLERAGADTVVNERSHGRLTVNGGPPTRKGLEVGDRVAMASVTLRFDRLRPRERTTLQKLYDASDRDGLTGLLTGRRLDALLAEDCAFAARHRTPLTLVGVDVTGFHELVDRHGYAETDAFLRDAAAAFAAVAPSDGVALRAGADRFVLVVRDEARDLPTRAQKAVERAGRSGWSVTTRAAVAELVESREPTPQALYGLLATRL